jgi:hypothetical protein
MRIGQRMLECLKRTDRSAELLADFGVRDGVCNGPTGASHGIGRNCQRPA